MQSYRNTVPVPRHWCQKRKYLQGKRGIEKTPFELPEFIAMTGIDKIRAAIEEADSLKKVCVCVCVCARARVGVFLFSVDSANRLANEQTSIVAGKTKR